MAGPASRVSRVLMTGPLAPFADAYRVELGRRGYAPLSTVKTRLPVDENGQPAGPPMSTPRLSRSRDKSPADALGEPHGTLVVRVMPRDQAARHRTRKPAPAVCRATGSSLLSG